MTSGGAGTPARTPEDLRDLGEHWPSGVGGVQCDDCGDTTIVRSFGDPSSFEPIVWLCLTCYRGDNDDE